MCQAPRSCAVISKIINRVFVHLHRDISPMHCVNNMHRNIINTHCTKLSMSFENSCPIFFHAFERCRVCQETIKMIETKPCKCGPPFKQKTKPQSPHRENDRDNSHIVYDKKEKLCDGRLVLKSNSQPTFVQGRSVWAHKIASPHKPVYSTCHHSEMV